jgi:ketosteroid isomerase-like protein
MAESLEDRVRLLEDEREITRRLYAYGHCIDYGIEDAFVDCFTEDATLSYSWDAANTVTDTGNAGDRRYEGRDEISGFVRNHTNAPDVYHKHALVEPQIELDGDRATATSYFMRLDRSGNGPMMSSFGRYRDVFVRSPDGRWRIKERRGEIESRVPVELRSVL